MKIDDVVQLLTIAHANEWNADTEKWLWVDDNILSPNDLPCTDNNVNKVELQLEKILVV
jgi:hypothetical protein